MHEEKITHTGFHAEIFRGQFSSGDIYLSKHYGKKSARGFEPSAAVRMIDHMRTFVELAGSIGVPVAFPVGHYIENNHVEGLVNLVEVVRHVGPDLKELIDSPAVGDAEVARFLDGYLAIFRRVWEADFPISLDPPPANFCVTGDNTLCFIDCMPPRQKLADGRLLSEMPDPPESSRSFIESRYFTVLQSRVIYAQLLRSLFGRTIRPLEIKELMGKHLGPVAVSLITLDCSTKERLLVSPQPTDVDMLRIMAGEAYFDGIISRDQMNAVYHSAHIATGGGLPSPEELRPACDILRNAYEKSGNGR